ncbi:MAG: riboflavin synthase [Thermodesulfobacteriota bacterium]|nr:MAG: riboflavin synthase [Thermodesulfobacteriota bacterium]
MFTGIIEATGTVISIEKGSASGKIIISTPFDTARMNDGDSVAVDGVCLTVTGKDPGAGTFTADLSAETLATTTLGSHVVRGSTVNLERALILGNPLGGHFVTGHIDGLGVIQKKVSRGGFVDLEVAVPEGLMVQVAKKGSIAVDGISLTVAGLGSSVVKIAVVPHTLKSTTLPEKHRGANVNIETDILAKYVQRSLSGAPEKLSEEFLIEHGFFGGG